jgi:CHAT domain-containing protein/tetratricopeptide (TPR) repeat protein
MFRLRSFWDICLLLCLALLLQPCSPAYAQADDPLALMGRVNALMREGKFADAIKVQKTVMAAIEKMAGARHPLFVGQISSLGDLHGLNGDNAEAERLHLRALALREDILGREHADVAASLASLANIYINVARYGDAETVLQRAMTIRRKALPESHPDYGFTFVNLGRVHMMRSRFADAEQSFRRAFDLLSRHLPPDHIYLPVVINNLAEASRALGRFAEAERLLKQALAASERTHGKDTQHSAPIINNLGQSYRQQGRFAEAETLMRRELAITEAVHGPNHLSASVSLNNLGTLMVVRGRPDEAVLLLRRALVIQEGAIGASHPETAKTLNNLAEALNWLDQAEEAERLFRQSLAIREQASGPDDLSVAIALDNLSAFLQKQKRYAEAEAMARRALAIRTAQQAANHPELALSIGNLAVALDNLGRHAEAKDLHLRAIAIKQELLGGSHPELAISLSNLGINRLDERDWQAAYDHFRRSNDIWLSRRTSLSVAGASFPAGDQELKRFSDSFVGRVAAGYELHRNASPALRSKLSDEGFAALQRASLSSAASALANMSARVAAGSPRLTALVREQQDLTEELQALDKSLIAAISSPPASRSSQGEADLRTRTQAVQSRLTALTSELAAQFPQFAALSNPEPSSIAEVRKALRPQEALYTVVLTRDGSFAWVITAETDRWVRIERSRAEIEDDVAALRCGLDAAAWASAKTRCPALTGQSYSRRKAAAGRMLPFDLERAHALYSTLFGQVEDLIAGRHLVIVPTGPLAQLPFNVLVTEKPSNPVDTEDYRSAAWLARRTAVTVLPSVNSLVALRAHTRPSAAPRPYLGLGNPLLNGPDAGYASLAAQALAKQTCNDPAGAGEIALLETRGIVSPMVTSGSLADIAFLRAQPPLPETADELCSVARNLKIDAASVHLGRKATETAIKALNKQGALAGYRVLHFATHGAMSGEIAGISEPGLVLTPPDRASAADDGYLAAGEIAALNLDADLVILSACNTAAGDAGDTEVLSGLARSFFYAGARSLLVSHWAVNSAVTVQLVTTALSLMNGDARLDRSEALRRSMLALIDHGGTTDAHPASWAPFVVVGEAAQTP